MSQFAQSQTTPGLETTTVNIPTTDVYSLVGTITTRTAQSPAVSTGPGGGAGTGVGGAPTAPSQVVATIKQNGSTIYTSQPADRGFAINALSCTAGDVITVALSSSLATDQGMNATRLTLVVSEGPI